MMRAAVYARKSSDNEAGVERQVEIARDFIAKQEWLPGPVFSDNAISGATVGEGPAGPPHVRGRHGSVGGEVAQLPARMQEKAVAALIGVVEVMKTSAAVREFLAAIGRKGGQVRSEAKDRQLAAARAKRWPKKVGAK